MFISKKKHHTVLERLERENAALGLEIRESRNASAHLAVDLIQALARQAKAEEALKTALAATEVVVRNSDSALELALAKYGEAVS